MSILAGIALFAICVLGVLVALWPILLLAYIETKRDEEWRKRPGGGGWIE